MAFWGLIDVHILFLTENFPPEVNASASRVYERAVYWVAAGHDVTVVTCFPNFPQGKLYPGWRQRLWQIDSVDGIRVVRLPTYVARNEGFVRRTADFVSFMFSAVLSTPFLPRPDVVVATSPQFFAAVAGWLVAGLKRRPFIFELGDIWPASIRAVGTMKASVLLDWLERLELFLYRRSAAVIALTPAFKADLVRRKIDARKIAVVVNGVDLPRYSPRDKDPEVVEKCGLTDAFTVGYIGTHGLAHCLENVVEAAASVTPSERIRFLLVGDGAAKPALVAACAARAIEAVVFVDPQPKARVPSFWSVCDVALVHLKNNPVFSEVIPSKIFEAMAMGLPILLAAPEGEASSIVRRERAGLVIPAGDPGELIAAIRTLREKPELRAEFARNSLAAAPRYSRRFQAEAFALVLEKVLSGESVAES